MGPPTIAMRCPACGRLFAAPAPPGAPAWYPCPHCGRPVTVVGPRDPPPLFSWEVYPNLYPPLPTPRAPRGPPGRPAGPILLAAAVVLAGLGGFLWLMGSEVLQPKSYTVQGLVLGVSAYGTSPLASAQVWVTGENGFNQSSSTNSRGTFTVPGVPAGGYTVKASANGYAAETIHAFLTSAYAAPAPGGAPVVLRLYSGLNAQATTLYESPFPDLETFVASLWSGTVVFGIGTFVTVVGALAAFRGLRPALSVVGAGAALLSPVSLLFLGMATVFPLLPIFGGVVAGLGAVAIALVAIPMARDGEPLEPDD